MNTFDRIADSFKWKIRQFILVLFLMFVFVSIVSVCKAEDSELEIATQDSTGVYMVRKSEKLSKLDANNIKGVLVMHIPHSKESYNLKVYNMLFSYPSYEFCTIKETTYFSNNFQGRTQARQDAKKQYHEKITQTINNKKIPRKERELVAKQFLQEKDTEFDEKFNNWWDERYYATNGEIVNVIANPIIFQATDYPLIQKIMLFCDPLK